MLIANELSDCTYSTWKAQRRTSKIFALPYVLLDVLLNFEPVRSNCSKTAEIAQFNVSTAKNFIDV